MNCFRLQCLVVVILLSAFHIVAKLPHNRGEFRVTNRMSTYMVFILHCYVGEDDRDDPEFINLQSGESKVYGFEIKMSESPTYTCVVSRPLDKVYIKFVAFAFHDKELAEWCGSFQACEWTIKNNGLYVRNANMGWEAHRKGWFHDGGVGPLHLGPSAM
ncbi:hypothetical protein ACFE04_005517 [Oxalis oulophora]